MSPDSSVSVLEGGSYASVCLDFDPARDGFSFHNRFEWTPDDLEVLATKLRPVTAAVVGAGGALGGAASGRKGGIAGLAAGASLGLSGLADGLVRRVARRWPTFGLCGGMALTAVERWPQRGSVATADLEAAPMRAMLRRAQERTLRASLPTFATWWLRARALRRATGPFADALEGELGRVQSALEAGRPVVLGVVGDAPDPFALHQVVAFGIERQGRLDATLTIYDPNAPGQSRTITTAPAPGGHTAISTSMPTGVGPSGRVHVSTRPGHLHHLFVVDVG